MAFPITARYFIKFRHSDSGLTPTFGYYKRVDTMADVTPPIIYEVANGTYYFEHTFALSTSPEIVFEVDGGASIPTEEVRYVSDTISPKDYYIDEPISQVHDDVWDDIDDRAVGTKGNFLENIGEPADASSAASLFGKALLYKELTRGDAAGASDGNDVKQVYARVGAPVGADISTDLQGVVTTLDSSIAATRASIKGVGNKDLTQVDADVLAGTASIAGDLTAAVSDIKGASNKDLTQVDTDVLAAETTLDGAITASQGVVTAAVTASTSSIKGTPAKDNAQLSTEIAAVGASTGVLPPDLTARLDYLAASTQRLLGLTKENSVLKNTFFDAQGNLIQGDLVLYSSAADALANLNAFASYRITAQWDGQKVQNYTMVKQP